VAAAIEGEALHEIMPHRGRMLLLSRVLGWSLEERSIEAECSVSEGCLFYDAAAGGIPSWAGFELIAQSIAAFSGIRDGKSGQPPKIGFVLAVSKMRMEEPFFPAGSALTIRSRETESMGPARVFEGEVLLNGRAALAGTLTVMEAGGETGAGG